MPEVQHTLPSGTASAGASPEVSVIIATYNMGQFVSRAIASVLAQQQVDLELIVVDDGSTDDTRQVLDDVRGEPRVRILEQENQGQPRAKNAGIRAARGNFIAFCDADDYWLPGKLALQLPLFASNPRAGVVYSTIRLLSEDGTLSTPQDHLLCRGEILETLFVRNVVPFGTAVVRRECLDQVGVFDESIPMGIDWDLWLRIAAAWEFDYVAEPTYVHRIWAGQMSWNWQGRYDCALLIMERFLARHPDKVSQSVVATAYADTYTSLAAAHLEHSGMSACLEHLKKALRHQPGFRPAWRLLAKAPWYRLRALARG